MRRLLPLLLIFLFRIEASAQAPSRAFETLTFHLSGTRNVDHSRFHRYWQPGAGGALSFSTPFYFGDVEAGALLHRYEPDDPGVPRFDAVLLFAGWGIPARPARWIRWHTGVRVGTYRMAFEEDVSEGVRNESELALAAHTRVEVFAYRGLGLHASGTYLKVFTFVRLELAYASVGLTYRLNTPGWLKAFLR